MNKLILTSVPDDFFEVESNSDKITIDPDNNTRLMDYKDFMKCATRGVYQLLKDEIQVNK